MIDENAPKIEQVPNWRLKEWFPDLNFETHNLLKKYFIELQKFNKVINLISAKSVLHADALHFADSILASRVVRVNTNKNNYLYDIGSGNGFPGLVYAILYPDQKMILVDSDQRKCEFLKHTAEALFLKNVIVQNIRIERISHGSIEQAICRGFSPLPKTLLILRKIMQNNGVVYHLKSEEWALEVSHIPIQLCSIWQPALEAEYVLPVGGIRMFVVKTSIIN